MTDPQKRRSWVDRVTNRDVISDPRTSLDTSDQQIRGFRKELDSYAEGSSMRIPYMDPSKGAKFGDAITDSDRFFGSTGEPVLRWIVVHVTEDDRSIC
jgi:hypothetical protein